MSEQLLLAKRLFLIGADYADNDDPISAGVAVSLFQDSAEIFIWYLLKHLDAKLPGDKTPFTAYFDLVASAEKNAAHTPLPLKAKIIELNNARVGFKHYGNLPDVSAAKKFKAYTEEFLVLSCSVFFAIDFYSLSLADLVPYPNIRSRLTSAEQKYRDNDYKGSIEDTAVAKAMLLELLANYFPKPDRNLVHGDDILRKLPGLHGVRLFSYLSDYLSKTNELNVISMLGIKISDYFVIQRLFPAALHMASGDWHFQYHARTEPNIENTRKAINMITSAAIRAKDLIGG